MWLRIFALFCICVVIALLGFPLVAPAINEALYSEKPFDSEAWKAGSVRQRARMARNLECQCINQPAAFRVPGFHLEVRGQRP